MHELCGNRSAKETECPLRCMGENAKCLLLKCVAVTLAMLRGRISGILLNHNMGHM